MKKISIIMSALALLAFTSCDKGNDDLGNDFIEDGFYVVGEATGSDEIQSAYMMAAGFNEVSKTKRDGMYEKYVALEADKTFSLAIYEAGDITYFGAEFADMNLTGLDNNPPIVIKRGALIEGENAPKMSVAETGLYHIVLDLNKNKDLNTPLIIVAPAKWGVRGAMNSWGYTPMNASEFNTKKITYTLRDTVEATGGFKFAYAHGWKVNMDDLGNVKAEIGLGNEAEENNLDLMPENLAQYGKDIKIRRGIYNISLVWTLKGGNLGKNFTASIEKVESLPAVDYADCVMELVGGGIEEQTGSYADAYWGAWGNCLKPANDGKPAVNGKVYTWTWSNVSLANDGWKIRTLNAADSGAAKSFDLGDAAVDTKNSVALEAADGNIKVAAGKYDIVLTIDADADEKTIVITAAK